MSPFASGEATRTHDVPGALPCRCSSMSTLTEHTLEVGELHSTELHHTRSQLDWLTHHRNTVGLSSAEQRQYGELTTREVELLRLVR